MTRPSFGDALGILFRTLARQWRTCLALSAPVGLLAGAGFAVVGALGIDPDVARRGFVDLGLVAATLITLGAAGSVVLVFTVVYPLASAGLAVVGARAISEERTTPGEALGAIVARGPAAIGAHIVSLMVVVALPMGLGLSAAVAALAGAPVIAAPLGLLAFAALIWPGFVYFVRFALSVSAAANEDVGVLGSLQRSAALVRDGFWWVLAFLALAAVVGGVISSIVSAPFPLDRGPVPAFIGQALGLTISTAVSGVAAGVCYATRAASPDQHPATVD